MEEEEGRGVWGGRERDGGECVVVRVSLVSDVVDVLFVCPQIESNFFKLAGLISQDSFPLFLPLSPSVDCGVAAALHMRVGEGFSP